MNAKSFLANRLSILVAALLVSALNLSFLAVPLDQGGPVRVEMIS
ncbi:hypothetical protein [Thermaurantiacus sp.]